MAVFGGDIRKKARNTMEDYACQARESCRIRSKRNGQTCVSRSRSNVMLSLLDCRHGKYHFDSERLLHFHFGERRHAYICHFFQKFLLSSFIFHCLWLHRTPHGVNKSGFSPIAIAYHRVLLQNSRDRFRSKWILSTGAKSAWTSTPASTLEPTELL